MSGKRGRKKGKKKEPKTCAECGYARQAWWRGERIFYESEDTYWLFCRRRYHYSEEDGELERFTVVRNGAAACRYYKDPEPPPHCSNCDWNDDGWCVNEDGWYYGDPVPVGKGCHAFKPRRGESGS